MIRSQPIALLLKWSLHMVIIGRRRKEEEGERGLVLRSPWPPLSLILLYQTTGRKAVFFSRALQKKIKGISPFWREVIKSKTSAVLLLNSTYCRVYIYTSKQERTEKFKYETEPFLFIKHYNIFPLSLSLSIFYFFCGVDNTGSVRSWDNQFTANLIPVIPCQRVSGKMWMAKMSYWYSTSLGVNNHKWDTVIKRTLFSKSIS